ncbi:LytR/AlgR family response regulator transcription factor [Rufibacter radiotolerans]|uniref:LytR/AlgR family response regulator transcription factor n=1 Tax=Rufibacter radiotolerans TaxID=1379910 RepID=UPI0006644F44|nr:LytTR family DNA-binding domain-containing protein [Rufibacter radiotolerans]
MLSFLRQPYPLSELTLSKSTLHALVFGFIIGFTLIVFQPFGTYTWHDPLKNYILAGYGLVAAVSAFLNYYAFRRMMPQVFTEDKWSVGKEIAWNLLHFGTGGFICTVYGAAVGVMPFSLAQVGYMSFIAFLMGLVPAVLLVLMNYVYLLQKYKPLEPVGKPEAPVAETTEIAASPSEAWLTLTAENEKDTLRLRVQDLLFIEASDNYCTVFHVEENRLQKTLLRSSLSRLENQMAAPGIFRCHRSYLVNFSQVQQVSGNAQGYKLQFAQTAQQVPVARSYAGVVKETFTAV